MKKVLIIGGGIVGLATGLKLALRHAGSVKISVLEKEDAPGKHQTGNNSGVLHCGLYYKPGSLKAKMAVSGIREMIQFCEKNQVAFEICGKLVVATNEPEVARLRSLEERGRANGLTGLRWLERDAMRQREPHVAGVAGLEVPEEGIVDYAQVCLALQRNLTEMGHEVRCGSRVVRITRVDGVASDRWRVRSARGEEITADLVINCAGLHCDRICKLAGSEPGNQIVPFRGEYYRLKPESQGLVKHLIYPVPDPAFPFLGVHFTRLIHGGVEAGPNAVLAFSREGYRKSDLNVVDLLESVTYPGLWKFAGRYPRMCWEELRQSFSKSLFCRALQKLVPEITVNDLEPGGAGVRAQAMGHDGTLIQDFAVVEEEGAVHVLNAPSPAATAALAIGDELVRRMTAQLN